ncbi:carbohydrate-binding domain-containing protein [Rothia sp. 11273D007AR]
MTATAFTQNTATLAPAHWPGISLDELNAKAAMQTRVDRKCIVDGLYARTDLTLAGEGTLYVTGNYGDGIASGDGLTISVNGSEADTATATSGAAAGGMGGMAPGGRP